MIAYLKGIVAAVYENVLILDVNQVGYQVYVSARDVSEMPGRGQEAQVFTWMSVSQDAIRLYGFLREDDLAMFRLLINVSGVGPKAALGILSVLTADDLRFAVLSDDAKTIAKAPGIGSKSARKVILELKDKLSLEDAFEHRLSSGQQNSATAAKEIHTAARDEAVQALAALGYSAAEALRAVNRCEITEDMDTETILKLALKRI
ncbi:MAG: Holliday junction branch migration protein RuvA [Lachnospiraceae bacterium]|nr:Holliday junction branch migration protein RuvA [Lachnospiraceae bacterium]